MYDYAFSAIRSECGQRCQRNGDFSGQIRYLHAVTVISTCEDSSLPRGIIQTGSQTEGFAKIFTAQRRNMPKKIDPLNKKQYGAVTAMLTVADVKAAVSFYQKAFGFAKRGIMNGPDGKPMHAELTLRGTTLMLGPENPERGARSAKTLGASPVTLYLTTENVEKVVATAVKLGG